MIEAECFEDDLSHQKRGQPSSEYHKDPEPLAFRFFVRCMKLLSAAGSGRIHVWHRADGSQSRSQAQDRKTKSLGIEEQKPASVANKNRRTLVAQALEKRRDEV